LTSSLRPIVRRPDECQGKGVLVMKLACAVDSDPSCPVFIA
jgi:hypothetical protein